MKWLYNLEVVLIGVLVTLSTAASLVPQVTVHPTDTGVSLTNPGMGWILYYYDEDLRQFGSALAPSDTVDYFPGLSVVYIRVPWSFVEPTEGKFNWSFIDTPAQRWVSRRKRIALRFTSTESAWPSPAFATPKWVMAAGAKGHYFETGKGVVGGGEFWEPDYGDPVFLDKLNIFLKAVASRYDGNPEVAFIDVGSFGVWGEGHTIWSTKIPYTSATVRRIVDIYRKNFKRTLLVVNDDFASQGRGEAAIDYARAVGLTLRDDSIMVHSGPDEYLSAGMAQKFWPDRPVILETQYYGISRDQGIWQDGNKVLEAVEAYHASYLSIHWWPKEFLDENKSLVERINRRLGYRLRITEVSWPSVVSSDSDFSFEYQWKNAGVAPCLPGGHVAFTLKQRDGGIAAVMVDDDFDARDLPVSAPETGERITRRVAVTFVLPPPLNSRTLVRPGIYNVYVSVGTLTGSPTTERPLPNPDGEGRYLLGAITVHASTSTKLLSPPE